MGKRGGVSIGDLAIPISEDLQISNKAARDLLHLIIRTMKTGLLRGENLEIMGLGLFYHHTWKARGGKLPHMAEWHQGRPNHAIRFTPCPATLRALEQLDHDHPIA